MAKSRTGRSNPMAELFPDPVFTGRYREGVAFREADLDKAVILGMCDWAMLYSRDPGTTIEGDIYIMSDVNEAYEKANGVILKASESYNKTLMAFRGAIKNDLASISSSADRSQKESQKINEAYSKTISLLTSENMERAIENAERLAVALKTISEINPSALTLSLQGSK